jgi:DnaK suppressor protein
MHHLSEEQIAQIKNLLLEMRQKILSSAQEQIKDPSNIAFEGGDEIDRANIETERYINLQRLKTRELKLLRKIDYALYKIEVGTYGPYTCHGGARRLGNGAKPHLSHTLLP